MFGSIGKALKSVGGGIINPAGLTDNSNFMSIIPGIGDSMAAAKQNQANIAAAQNAMQFSERMSSTAYQRGMADMKKAGLNPMLAYMQGGASAPTGVTPTINSETKSGLGAAAISTALGVKGLQTQQQNADTQRMQANENVKLTGAQKDQAESATALNAANTAKSMAEAERTRSETRRTNQEINKNDKYQRVHSEVGDLVDSLFDKLGTSAKEKKGVNTALEPLGNAAIKGFHKLRNESKKMNDTLKKRPELKMDYKIGF